MSPKHATAGPRTAALLEQVEALAAATELGGSRIPRATAVAVRTALAGVRERLALGVDHTVVALVGGTGSGKSTVFNALTGLEFADVGVKRPTTSAVTACVWAHDASALLDWLGVARDRRIERESELDGESQADLRGLVLLDLPDHDSIEPEHRAVVDRLLPLVDLLVWVVDPQKYADDALHTGYLRHLVGHENAMLVVLNQMDTVPAEARDSLLSDVARLLALDGLVDVGLHATSARSGDGVPAVREALARVVAGHGVAELRAAVEIDDAARVLETAVGGEETAEQDLPRAAAVTGLAEAAGLTGLIAGVQRAVRSGTAVGGTLGPLQADRSRLVRTAWVDLVGHGMPAAWRDALDAAVAPPGDLVAAADTRVAEVRVDVRPVRGALVARVLAAVLGVLTAVGVGLTVGAVSGDGGWGDQARSLALLTAVTALGVVVLLSVGAWLRRSTARRRAATLDTAARAALAEVVDRLLVAPSVSVLADHRGVRTLAAARVAAPLRD